MRSGWSRTFFSSLSQAGYPLLSWKTKYFQLRGTKLESHLILEAEVPGLSEPGGSADQVEQLLPGCLKRRYLSGKLSSFEVTL